MQSYNTNNTTNNLIITLPILHDTGLYNTLLWLRFNADELVYSLTPTTKKVFYFLHNKFLSANSLAGSFGASRNSLAKLNKDNAAKNALQIDVEDDAAVVIIDSELFDIFNNYLVDKFSNCKERSTFCRVFFYMCYCCGGVYGKTRTQRSLEHMSSELGLERQCLQRTLRVLIEDRWIIRYGCYSVEEGRGYSYTLKDEILELIVSSGNK